MGGRGKREEERGSHLVMMLHFSFKEGHLTSNFLGIIYSDIFMPPKGLYGSM